MLKLETVEDLEQLIKEEIQESLTLEYKASASLGRGNNQRNELIKDVSAFANSAGGQIVYGIEEIDRKPIRLDGGSEVGREWIEQVIDTNVQPRIEGLVIRPISLKSGNHAYAIDIPPAVARAPHQALDNKYYKRQNFQSIPMEDYEIRDIFHRAKTPDLFAKILFTNGRADTEINLSRGADKSDVTDLQILIGNNSSQPAYYTAVILYFDSRLLVNFSGGLTDAGIVDLNTGQNVRRYYKLMVIPHHAPIFKELEVSLIVPPFSFQVPGRMLDNGMSFALGYEIRTPGQFVRQFGRLNLPGRVMTLQMDPPTANG
jgi:Putative DNA-binding domain